MSDEHQPADWHGLLDTNLDFNTLLRADCAKLASCADRFWAHLAALGNMQKNEHSYRSSMMMCMLFQLAVKLDNDGDALKEFVKNRNLQIQSNKNIFFVVTNAVMRHGESKQSKTLQTYYAHGLIVLDRNKITPENAMCWLREPLYGKSGGRGLTGLSKTNYLWSLEREGVEAREKKMVSRQRKDRAKVEYLFGSGFGSVGQDTFAADKTALLEGEPMLALVKIVGGKPVPMNLLTADPIQLASAIRQCLQARYKKQDP